MAELELKLELLRLIHPIPSQQSLRCPSTDAHWGLGLRHLGGVGGGAGLDHVTVQGCSHMTIHPNWKLVFGCRFMRHSFRRHSRKSITLGRPKHPKTRLGWVGSEQNPT